jgi:hypothetical protein
MYQLRLPVRRRAGGRGRHWQIPKFKVCYGRSLRLHVPCLLRTQPAPARALFAVHLAFWLWVVHMGIGQAAEQGIKSGTPVVATDSGSDGGAAAEHREYLTRQVEEDFIRHRFRGLACAPECARVLESRHGGSSVHQFMVQLAVAAAAGQHWQSGA